MELITTLRNTKTKCDTFDTTYFPFCVLSRHECRECKKVFVDCANVESIMYLGVCEDCWND
jgi:hypothetical protein